MTKHTPGEWTLQTVPINYGSGCVHKIGPFPSSNSFHKETFACVYADGVRLGIDEKNPVAQELLANARLIAASPDLLAACEESLRILPLAMDSDLDFDAKTKAEYIARYPLIVQLKAAIAKATGGPQ